MTRPRKSPAGRPSIFDETMTKMLWVKMPDHLVEAIDAIVEKERKAHPGRRVSRADVVRELIAKAVAKR